MFFFLQTWAERLRIRSGTQNLFRTDLSSVLASATSADSLGAKIQWLENLLSWIRIPSAPDSGKVSSQIQAVRVKFFLQILERNPEWKKNVSRVLVSIFLETEAVRLLCETGMNTGEGFVSEAGARFMHRILPLPRNERDLAELFTKIFTEESDADWLETIDEPTLQSLLNLIFQEEKERSALEKRYAVAFSEAMIILSSHLESLGLTSDIRLRSHVVAVRWSAFYRLRMAVSSALEGKPGTVPDFSSHFLACREEINSAFAHLEEHGVSVSIVYRLEKMERYLGRLEALVAIHFSAEKSTRTGAWIRLMADLVRSRLRSEQIGALVQHNLHMLARKIVERTGATGEHYITSSRSQYFNMLVSAAGGGFLTAGTAWLKIITGKASPALFFEGLFSWVNFSGSFILMQAFHFTLATKQPSMTAPALAAKLKSSQGSGEFADLVARITRSQFAAAMGNIGMVIPVALVADFLYLSSTGRHIIPEYYAVKVIASLHPWKSLTVPYAALTGLILWVSSIGAGWAENWFVFRRLPETVHQSPLLKKIFGPKRAEKIAGWICHNVAGLGGNLTLGFLLAFTPVSGRFFGLPLDVRHVTLSTAALTFSICAIPHVEWRDVMIGGLSIALIGILNFGLSFVAALVVAVKAREVKRARLAVLRRSLWGKFRRQPLDFLFPLAK